jgi:signal transduction histidine kinase
MQNTSSNNLHFVVENDHNFDTGNDGQPLISPVENINEKVNQPFEEKKSQHDLLDIETAQQRLSFLLEASTLLASSLDYEVTLQNVSMLAVHKLSDWCSIHLIDEEAEKEGKDPYRLPLLQVAIAHKDPAKVDWGLRLQKELNQRYPYNPDAPTGIPCVIRTGNPELYPVINEELIRASTSDEELIRVMLEINYCSIMLVPLKVREKVIGCIQLVNTETRRHFNEQDLELAQDLARRAAMAIDNARLYREAQRAIKIRDEFLSVAAHELKTPISSLKGYSQLISRRFSRRGEIETERLVKMVEVINRQSDKLNYLVSQLLDKTRLEAGRLELKCRLTNIAELVEEAITSARILQPETKEREHNLQLILASDEPFLAYVDPVRFEQVITNLLSNAIKYSPEGGQVDIKLTIEDSPQGKLLKLSVRDYGLGVPEEHRSRLFERFYQAIHSSQNIGMGLGLYISQQIVLLHGGNIEAIFPPDGGACFVVSVPTRVEEAAHF